MHIEKSFPNCMHFGGPEVVRQTLARAIGQKMEQSHMTVRDVASSTGYDVQTIMNISDHQQFPKFQETLSILLACKLQIADIFRNEKTTIHEKFNAVQEICAPAESPGVSFDLDVIHAAQPHRKSLIG